MAGLVPPTPTIWPPSLPSRVSAGEGEGGRGRRDKPGDDALLCVISNNRNPLYLAAMTFMPPIYDCSTSGTAIEPSACW